MDIENPPKCNLVRHKSHTTPLGIECKEALCEILEQALPLFCICYITCGQPVA
jgi:hypothetical protein